MVNNFDFQIATQLRVPELNLTCHTPSPLPIAEFSLLVLRNFTPRFTNDLVNNCWVFASYYSWQILALMYAGPLKQVRKCSFCLYKSLCHSWLNSSLNIGRIRWMSHLSLKIFFFLGWRSAF